MRVWLFVLLVAGAVAVTETKNTGAFELDLSFVVKILSYLHNITHDFAQQHDTPYTFGPSPLCVLCSNYINFPSEIVFKLGNVISTIRRLFLLKRMVNIFLLFKMASEGSSNNPRSTFAECLLYIFEFEYKTKNLT